MRWLGKRLMYGGESYLVSQEGRSSCVVCRLKDHLSPNCGNVAAMHRCPIIASSKDEAEDAPAPPAKSGDKVKKGPLRRPSPAQGSRHSGAYQISVRPAYTPIIFSTGRMSNAGISSLLLVSLTWSLIDWVSEM